jgi:hypothetical protein
MYALIGLFFEFSSVICKRKFWNLHSEIILEDKIQTWQNFGFSAL